MPCCPGQTPAWKILCSGSGLTGNGVRRGTAARTDYKAVLRTGIKLPLPWAGNTCLCSCTHTCSLIHGNPKFISSPAHSRAAPLQVPLGTSFRKALITCKDRVLPPPQIQTDSYISVMPWPREVGQNTRVGPAQTFTANDGAERSQSCFILLVFLASLRSKRGRKGCFQHREQRKVMESLSCIS